LPGRRRTDYRFCVRMGWWLCLVRSCNSRIAHFNHSDRNAFTSNCRNKVRPQDRRPATDTSTLGLRTPPGLSQRSADGASISAKPAAVWADGVHLSVDASRTASQAVQADMTVTGSIAPSAPLVPTPETRPTTLECWTVIDVRGGTAVLGGPEAVRIATRGDTVPGIGRREAASRRVR
jgi:hypothetical protein